MMTVTKIVPHTSNIVTHSQSSVVSLSTTMLTTTDNVMSLLMCVEELKRNTDE